MEDALLIRRIKQGDEAAFDELVRRHYDSIYAFCYRRCADRSLAADLTQEVFLKLVTAVYRYSVTGKFTNYLFTIAVNVCNDYYRRKKPDSAELSEDCAALGGAAAHYEALGAVLHLGEGYLRDLDADVVFRTPGMRPDVPELLEANLRAAAFAWLSGTGLMGAF